MDKQKRKIIQKAGRYFTETEKHLIIRELISAQCNKVEICEKYTGEEQEHGQLLRWMKALGYHTGIKTRRPNIVSNFISMPKKKQEKAENKDHKEDKDFEYLQLKKRIAELEKQLKDAEMKAIAFSTMVDIAEKEFKIPVRKKLNTTLAKRLHEYH